MICYTLACAAGHRFEAWFRSGADFTNQSETGLLSCPLCGGAEVRQALMAPAVVKGSGERGARADARAGPKPDEALQGEALPPGLPAAAGQSVVIPDAVRAVLSRMRDQIERHCDDVGRDFADEAIAMHRGERERRGIYGQTTEAERQHLLDEGVEVARIPWLPRSDG